MTSYFAQNNFIDRSIDKISPFEIGVNESYGDVLFTISGEGGSGKTTFVRRSLGQIAGNTQVIVVDRSDPLLVVVSFYL